MFFRKSIDIKTKKLGVGHPETLDVIDRLGACYELKKWFSKAEEKYLMAYKGRMKIFGDGHESTCQSATHIGSLYRKLSRWKECSEMYKVAYSGYCKLYGSDHFASKQALKLLEDVKEEQSSTVCTIS